MSFKVETLVQTVRQIAADRPQVIYNSEMKCSYSDGTCSDNTVGCLFGQAFAQMGVVVPENLDSKTIGMVINNFGGIYNPLHLEWCCAVQLSQDIGGRWGFCIRKADAYILERYGVLL